MKTKKKTFDCVACKRQAQARIYEVIRNLSPEEEIAYFRKAAEEGPLGEWWRSLTASRHSTAGPSRK